MGAKGGHMAKANIELPMFSTDINEIKIYELDHVILDLLLADKSSKRNILWATKDYLSYGNLYDEHCQIMPEQITYDNLNIIQPRVLKEKDKQTSRTKGKAEVFTPAYVCNKQLNLVDDAWFGHNNIFNKTTRLGWKTIKRKIVFSDKKPYRWQDYIDLKRLEITCGEAPYITSRYDMQTGTFIPVQDRIGILDRKLRIVSENTSCLEDWIKWATRSIESVYGFEFQGDSLIIARENVLFTFIENMYMKFECVPDAKLLKKIANIIAWNIWQMDAFTYSIPYGKKLPQYQQTSLFADEVKNNLCKIKDWRSKETLTYSELFKEGD